MNRIQTKFGVAPAAKTDGCESRGSSPSVINFHPKLTVPDDVG